MDRDWRRLTRAAYAVAGHLDAAAFDPEDGASDDAAGRGGSHRAGGAVRRPPRLRLTSGAARAVTALALLLTTILLVRSCASPAAQDVPARAASPDVVTVEEGAEAASQDGGAPAGQQPAWRGDPAPDPTTGADDGAGSGADTERAADAQLVVHVAGAVTTPGLVTLPAGARVGDALAAAGGPAPGAQVDAVNLARPVVDGEQIRVPVEGEPLPAADAPAPGGTAAPGGTPDSDGGGTETQGRIDLNRADAAQLETLPGIGPALAGRIIDHRQAIGGFRDVAELDDVSGIGPTVFGRLEPLVTVGP